MTTVSIHRAYGAALDHREAPTPRAGALDHREAPTPGVGAALDHGQLVRSRHDAGR